MKNLNLQSRLNWEWDGWSVYFIDIRLYLTLDHSYWSSPQSTPTVRSEIHSLLFQFRAAQTRRRVGIHGLGFHIWYK